MAEEDTGAQRPSRGALVTLVLVGMLNCMGGAAVAPTLPLISEAFPQASETLISLIVTLPSLGALVSALFVGAVADRVGKARTLAVSLALLAAAGLSGTVLPTLESILAGRFVLGIAIAGTSTSSTALVSELYSGEERARVFGWQSAANGISILVLETLGGFLALLGWRVPFSVYLVAVVLFAMAVLLVREPRRGGPDATEAAAGPAGRLPRAVAGVAAVTLALVLVCQVVSFQVPSKMPYLIDDFQGSTVVSGLYLGVFGVANIAASLLFARMMGRVGRWRLALAGFACLGGGCACMGLAGGLAPVAVGVAFAGFGVGTVMPTMQNWLAAVTTRRNSGKFMGALGVSANVGQFASSLAAGGLLAAGATHQGVFQAAGALGLACAVVCAAGFLLFARLEHVTPAGIAKEGAR